MTTRIPTMIKLKEFNIHLLKANKLLEKNLDILNLNKNSTKDSQLQAYVNFTVKFTIA